MLAGVTECRVAGHDIQVRRMEQKDLAALVAYYDSLQESTRKTFCPHAFTTASLEQIYRPLAPFLGFIAFSKEQQQIIGYAVLRIGLLEHDLPRLQQYLVRPGPVLDFTYAPSVADAWQGSGLGTVMLGHITSSIYTGTPIRLVLWGGVQASNTTAIRFYRKNGFTFLSEFSHNGQNFDMALIITG